MSAPRLISALCIALSKRRRNFQVAKLAKSFECAKKLVESLADFCYEICRSIATKTFYSPAAAPLGWLRRSRFS